MSALVDMAAAGPIPKRKRDAATTREAILASAIDAFGRLGYDGAGMRGIAKDAGVTAKLVNRYFGTKEKLFAEAVDASFLPPTIVRDALDPDAEGSLAARLGEVLVRRTAPDALAHGPFLIALRSSANPVATEAVREGIERHVVARMTALLDAEEADMRGELALALTAGVWLLRHIIGLEALTGADPERLGVILTELFDVLVED